jgi:hypothetical protein
MSCEHLICAQCGSPVVEGRCPACRAARQQVHHHSMAGPQLLIAAILVLAFVMLLAMHVGR